MLRWNDGNSLVLKWQRHKEQIFIPLQFILAGQKRVKDDFCKPFYYFWLLLLPQEQTSITEYDESATFLLLIPSGAICVEWKSSPESCSAEKGQKGKRKKQKSQGEWWRSEMYSAIQGNKKKRNTMKIHEAVQNVTPITYHVSKT